MNLIDRLSSVSYYIFGEKGSLINRLFKNLPNNLERADVKIHPIPYGCMVIFLTLIATSLSVIAWFFLSGILGLLSLSVLLVPIIMLITLVYYPSIAVSSRTSSLETEIPYAATYITVLATSGISAHKSIQRLKDVKELLPNISSEASKIDLDIRAFGIDPVTAIKKSALRNPSKDYSNLFSGYASTLAIGGDVTHYLLRSVEMLFKARISKVKIIGDRLMMLMEAYIAFNAITAITTFVIFIISKAFPIFEGGFTDPTIFAILAWVLLPMTSIGFIYLIDITQQKYPREAWLPYRVLAYNSPVIIFSAFMFVLPFYIEPLAIIANPFTSLIYTINEFFKLSEGYALSTGIILSTTISIIPPMIADITIRRDSEKTFNGITMFLRDLVEIRKTGMTPERCMISLSNRAYGKFSEILRLISAKLMLGTTYRDLYNSLKKKIHGWLSKISMFLLLDLIDVGGSSPETLETLASFNEDMHMLEKERRSVIKPLVFLPYVSSLIILGTVLIMIKFIQALLLASQRYFAFDTFVSTFLPPVIINNILAGLIAGKVSEGRISAGFKHVFLINLITLIGILIISWFNISLLGMQ